MPEELIQEWGAPQQAKNLTISLNVNPGRTLMVDAAEDRSLALAPACRPRRKASLATALNLTFDGAPVASHRIGCPAVAASETFPLVESGRAF